MYIVTIDEDKCTGCGECANTCPASIITVEDGKATVSGELTECLGCESCVSVCENEAVSFQEV